MAAAGQGGQSRGGFYLPDFCTARSVLAIVLIAELAALLLTLARYGIAQRFWGDLARTSLFMLWIGLGSAALLCWTRPWLQRQGLLLGSSVALGLLVGATLAVSEAAWQLLGSSLLEFSDASLTGSHAAFLWRNLAVGAIIGGLALRYFYVQQQWKRNVEAEAQSRVRALQSRIRPHFLFNSMNTIAALTRSDPARAEEAVTDLADLFRAALRESRNSITLAEELEIARTYERIERLRLGDRLTVDWQVRDVPGDAIVPALVLQPLLENAVGHGIEQLAEGGTISVTGRLVGRHVELCVDNPVSGSSSSGSGDRVGLDSVRQRLELMYPGEAGLEVVEPPGRFVVTMRFPAGGRDR
ncbi:MAG: histidine kinase [Gammaproteobacteria bacterium]|jgi:two-component system sensor histidine kinase AlgZ|nr:histidine kinase [Gammaproteobacteria bacterium]